MRVYDIIIKKRNGCALTSEEITFMIEEYCRGTIPDYQMAAFLMAVYFRGMNSRESVDLTMAMVNSGEKVNLQGIKGFKVDKHSTGGVGDTTTLVLAPLVAACGGTVAKMTGRGLGHTGGTVDKLESIPGFRVELEKEKFVDNVNRIHLSVISQTADLAPADKKLYALRDVTATVDSIPLIASSIMSKKLAAGADGIVLDVKTGTGAFMVRYEDALQLAQTMVNIGEGAGKRMVALITGMEQPLGYAVGNAIEVKEAIETLSGRGPEDLTDLCVELGANMLWLSSVVSHVSEGRERMKEAVVKRKGLEKLKEMVRAQEGNPGVIENPGLLPRCKEEIEIPSPRAGYVQSIDALSVGISSQILGAGRQKKEDIIDLSVGIYLRKKVGDQVAEGEPLAVFHTDGNKEKIERAWKIFTSSYSIGKEKVDPPCLLYSRVTKERVEEFNRNGKA